MYRQNVAEHLKPLIYPDAYMCSVYGTRPSRSVGRGFGFWPLGIHLTISFFHTHVHLWWSLNTVQCWLLKHQLKWHCLQFSYSSTGDSPYFIWILAHTPGFCVTGLVFHTALALGQSGSPRVFKDFPRKTGETFDCWTEVFLQARCPSWCSWQLSKHWKHSLPYYQYFWFFV